MAKKPSIFISYRRDPSSDLARYLRRELVDAGADVFLDVEDINKGRFENVIRSKIETCDSFLIILAPETLDSEWVRKEIDLALETDRNIIPLMMPDFSMEAHVPPEMAALRRIHGIPYNHFFAEAALDKVKKAVGTGEKPVSLAVRLSNRGCSLQVTVALATLLVMFGAALLFTQQNALPTNDVSLTANISLTGQAVNEPSKTPPSTRTPPPLLDTTATRIANLDATATEAVLQGTAIAKEATNAALMTQNARLVQTITATLTPSNTPSLTPTPRSTSGLVVGGLARVRLPPGFNRLNVRSAPDQEGLVRAELLEGEIVTILENPQAADGFLWWKVRTADGIEGWAVEAVSGSQQALIPVEATTPEPTRVGERDTNGTEGVSV